MQLSFDVVDDERRLVFSAEDAAELFACGVTLLEFAQAMRVHGREDLAQTLAHIAGILADCAEKDVVPSLSEENMLRLFAAIFEVAQVLVLEHKQIAEALGIHITLQDVFSRNHSPIDA